jgi:hypothetical protein
VADARCDNVLVRPPPGGLVEGQRRPKVLRLVRGGDWYVADRGRFEKIGSGDLSVRDLKAVRADLRESAGADAVFVCVARPREVEQVLTHRWGTRRITWSTRLKKPIAPKLAWVARGARLALLPGDGIVWVDGERLFTPGETVPLPWTDPPVELKVVRPKTVRTALKTAVGPKGPRRAVIDQE